MSLGNSSIKEKVRQVEAFKAAKGIYLDSLGAIIGIERKRYWIFKESDKKMRKRCMDVIYYGIKRI